MTFKQWAICTLWALLIGLAVSAFVAMLVGCEGQVQPGLPVHADAGEPDYGKPACQLVPGSQHEFTLYQVEGNCVNTLTAHVEFKTSNGSFNDCIGYVNTGIADGWCLVYLDVTCAGIGRIAGHIDQLDSGELWSMVQVTRSETFADELPACFGIMTTERNTY